MFSKFEKKNDLLSMESESNLHHKNTEQLINGMMSFLDETPEYYKKEDFDDSKNPLCAGIKNVIEMCPPPPAGPQNSNMSFQSHQDDSKIFSNNNQTKSSHIDNACRYKDPYMQEVNRLMFCSTMGHPPNGSPEHFLAAESYALHGKNFLDFPTETRFQKPMDVGCFGDASLQFPSSFPKSITSQVYGLPATNKNPSLGNTSVPPQLPVMMNPTNNNYWGYPFYQTPVQPSMIYANPFLMTQYLNMFVRETQINTTSIVQQHQFLTGGIHERLVYAQMLQQQAQTNQAGQVNSCYSGISGVGVGKPKISKLQDLKKSEPPKPTSDGSDFMKAILNGSNLCENNVDLDD